MKIQLTNIKYQISETMVQITVSKYQISETGVWTGVAGNAQFTGTHNLNVGAGFKPALPRTGAVRRAGRASPAPPSNPRNYSLYIINCQLS
jgi:hypothetical protein